MHIEAPDGRAATGALVEVEILRGEQALARGAPDGRCASRAPGAGSSGRAGTPGAPGRGVKLRLLRSLALLGLACAACSDAPPRARSPAWSIARDDIRSVPELLATLPESLRARYVLLFETRSPQGASYEAPRAILFSDDAREVVAFGGGSDSVDLMTFDDTSTSFVLREVTFPVLAGQPRMVVSEANPARCRACHGTPAGPIWDTYPLWPGAYGESDRLPPPEEERQGLARFSSQREAHPRYRYLPVHRTTAADEAERRYLGQAAVAANAELGELLGGLSARVIAAELRAAPGFERHRYDALAALVPLCRERGGARERPDYAAFVDATWRANAVQAAYKQARAHLPPGTALPSVPDDTAMTRLRYVAERDLGVSTAGWTLALEKGTFDYEASRRPAGSLARRLFQELVGADDRLPRPLLERRRHDRAVRLPRASHTAGSLDPPAARTAARRRPRDAPRALRDVPRARRRSGHPLRAPGRPRPPAEPPRRPARVAAGGDRRPSPAGGGRRAHADGSQRGRGRAARPAAVPRGAGGGRIPAVRVSRSTPRLPPTRRRPTRYSAPP